MAFVTLNSVGWNTQPMLFKQADPSQHLSSEHSEQGCDSLAFADFLWPIFLGFESV